MPTADDLVSVTVKKTDPDQKVGIGLVKQQKNGGGVFVTKLSKHGLFQNTEIEIDDKILSINGNRIGKDESIDDFMQHIITATEKVTIVVKKANVDPSSRARSKSPTRPGTGTGGSRKKKMFTKDVLNSDGSFNPNVDPSVSSYTKATGADDDKAQIRIRVKKDVEGQRSGLAPAS